jgi:hypothetical protein
MRKTLIILAISLISLVASAQGSFKLINDTYNNEKGISIIQLDKELIDLYKRDNISKQDLEILKSIEEVNIFTCSKDDGYEGKIKKLNKSLRELLVLSRYKLVKSKVDSDGFSKVYIKKTDKNKSELLVINSINEEKSNIIILRGDIKLSNIYRLAYALKIDGLKELKEINKSFSSRKHKKKYKTKAEKFFNGETDNKKEYDSIKMDMKQKLKNCNFEGDMDSFEESMERWGKKIEIIADIIRENVEESLRDIDDNIMIDDKSYNIAFKGGKATINISPDEESVCIRDGEKVKNSKIKELKAGEINRVRVVKRNKTNENYLIITSHKKIGKYITPKGGRKIGQSGLKFIYNGETYTYSEKEKIFPGYIINGKKKESLYTKQYINSEIIQIRPISKIEKKAFKAEKDRIVIETK